MKYTLTTEADLPDVALSVQQPWAGLIVIGVKDIENRMWLPAQPPGPVAIHAGRTYDKPSETWIAEVLAAHYAWERAKVAKFFAWSRRNTGGVIGSCDIHNLARRKTGKHRPEASPWAMHAQEHLLLRDQRILRTIVPAKGQLKFFKWR